MTQGGPASQERHYLPLHIGIWRKSSHTTVRTDVGTPGDKVPFIMCGQTLIRRDSLAVPPDGLIWVDLTHLRVVDANPAGCALLALPQGYKVSVLPSCHRPVRSGCKLVQRSTGEAEVPPSEAAETTLLSARRQLLHARFISSGCVISMARRIGWAC